MAMANNFNLRSGTHRLIALLALMLAAAAFAIMLGGVASLQASCNNDLNLGTNNNLAGLAGTGTAGATQALNVLASRSTTGAFTLTPDTRCSHYYRYQWLTVAFEAFACMLVFLAIVTNLAHVSRVALCCILVITTMLTIENANTFQYFKDYTNGATHTRAKVFFAGCIIANIANILLILILGTHNEAMGYNGFLGAETARPVQAGALPAHHATHVTTHDPNAIKV